MQKSESQITGHLYKKGAGDTWQSRYIIFNIENGSFKIYAEKSGKRIIKEQVNLKNSLFARKDQSEIGRSLAFSIQLENLKSPENNILYFSAENEDIFNEWTNSIQNFLGIQVSSSDPLINNKDKESSHKPNPNDFTNGNFIEECAETFDQPNAQEVYKTAEIEKKTPELNDLSQNKEKSILNNDYKPSNFENINNSEIPNNVPFSDDENNTAKDCSPSESAEKSIVEETTDRPQSEQIDELNDKLNHELKSTPLKTEVKFEEGSSPILEKIRDMTKDYHTPKFKNLLNSNGLETKLMNVKENTQKENVNEVKKKINFVIQEEKKPMEEGTLAKKKVRTSFVDIQKFESNLSEKPTGSIRMGHLFKMDSSSKDKGEDSWLNQYISFDIRSGELAYFTEINGRRIPRGRFNIKNAKIRTIDSVYYGRLFSFKISNKMSSEEYDKSGVFAAEDFQSLCYWMVSFEDSKKYLESPKEIKSPEIKVEKKNSHIDTSVSNLDSEEYDQFPPTENISRIKSHSISSLNVNVSQSSVSHENLGEEQRKPQDNQDSSHFEKLSSPTFLAKQSLSRQPSFHFPATPQQNLPNNDLNNEIVQKALSRSGSKLSTLFDPIEHEKREGSIGLEQGLSDRGSFIAKEPNIQIINPLDKEIDNLVFIVKKIKYPADRLARRIKIWYSSSGFSLSSNTEIDQFVSELQSTEDSILQSFSEEKFSNILDWANLLEILRKYELKSSLANPVKEIIQGPHINLTVEICLSSDESKTLLFNMDQNTNFDLLSAKISDKFGMTKEIVRKKLPEMFIKPNNPFSQSLEIIKDDLTFAEDLVLYQEEVIDNLWESYNALKKHIEEKDKVITSLYSKLSGTTGIEELRSPLSHKSESYSTSSLLLPLSQSFIDTEFTQADKDGNGHISREEWRSWMEEKQNLIKSHNEVKSNLINEIKNLRKSLNPTTEQSFFELKRSESIRAALEEDLVNTQIQNDNYKKEIEELKAKLEEMEVEKSMIETHWEEKLKSTVESFEKSHSSKTEVKRKSLTSKTPVKIDIQHPTHVTHNSSHSNALTSKSFPVSRETQQTYPNSSAALDEDKIFQSEDLNALIENKVDPQKWSLRNSMIKKDLVEPELLESPNYEIEEKKNSDGSFNKQIQSIDHFDYISPYHKENSSLSNPRHTMHFNDDRSRTSLNENNINKNRNDNSTFAADNSLAKSPYIYSTEDDLAGIVQKDLLVNRSQYVKTEHPLRAAIKQNMFQKINGGSKTGPLMSPKTPNRSNVPKSPYSYSDTFYSPNNASSRFTFEPKIDSTENLNNRDPYRFMKKTHSWNKKSQGEGEPSINSRYLVNRSSGGWKFT